MDVGTGGTWGTFPPPHFLKSRENCPFSYNLAALLEDAEDAEITSKIHVSSGFIGSKFQNFRGEHAPRPL